MQKSFLDLFFPRSPRRLDKASWRQEFPSLLQKTTPIYENKTVLLSKGIFYMDSVLAASNYNQSPLIKQAISEFKYYNGTWLLSDLSKLLIYTGHHNTLSKDVAFCSVPLHWTRQFNRGFNQSGLLAGRLGNMLNIPVLNLVKRTKKTGHQAWRNREERLRAVKSAFACICGPPKTVILIDDVMTTGATLDACAKALKESGSEQVHAWVVAHDPTSLKYKK